MKLDIAEISRNVKMLVGLVAGLSPFDVPLLVIARCHSPLRCRSELTIGGRFQVAYCLGQESNMSEISLPIRPPAHKQQSGAACGVANCRISEVSHAMWGATEPRDVGRH